MRFITSPFLFFALALNGFGVLLFLGGLLVVFVNLYVTVSDRGIIWSLLVGGLVLVEVAASIIFAAFLLCHLRFFTLRMRLNELMAETERMEFNTPDGIRFDVVRTVDDTVRVYPLTGLDRPPTDDPTYTYDVSLVWLEEPDQTVMYRVMRGSLWGTVVATQYSIDRDNQLVTTTMTSDLALSLLKVNVSLRHITLSVQEHVYL